MTMSSRQLSQWGRVGGIVRTSVYDPAELARSGQNGLLRRFEHQVDPDGTLDPEERLTRVLRLRHAHMIRMSIRATEARARKTARVAADGID